jgi:hypothetical protein
MKNYRVWEANRKVFLYPENWIEPELRDDKTPFFKDLETELLQNELTDQTVETALVNYLYKLDEVARLDIRGFCKEEKKEGTGEKEIYHVFGRTWNPPYVYFYRRGIFPKDGPVADEWTPWERVDLDIQGDHLIPVVAKGRLYLFWLVFDRKPISPSSTDQPAESDNGGSTASSPPKEQWQIRLCWSEYQGGKWSSKTVGEPSLGDPIRILAETVKGLAWRSSKERLAQELGTTDPDVVNVPGRYGARISLEDERIIIRVGEEEIAFIPWGGGLSTPFCPDDELNFDSVGSFVLGPCRQQLTIREDENWTVYGPQESTNNGVVIISKHGTLHFPHIAKDAVLKPNLTIYDKKQPLFFVLTPLNIKVPNNPWLMTWYPFFFRDNSTKLTQCYFARPVVSSLGPLVVFQMEDSTEIKIEIIAQVDPFHKLKGIEPDPVLELFGGQVGNRATRGFRIMGGIAMSSLPGNTYQIEKLRFYAFHHPFVCDFIDSLQSNRIPGLLALDRQGLGEQPSPIPLGAPGSVFYALYGPTEVVNRPYPPLQRRLRHQWRLCPIQLGAVFPRSVFHCHAADAGPAQ